MIRRLMSAAVVAVALGLAGCATNELSGQRIAAPGERVPFKSVDVVFVNQTQLKEADGSGSIGDQMARRTTAELHLSMREMRLGTKEAMEARGIPGRTLMMSEQFPATPGALRPSHVLFVKMEQAQASLSRPIEFFWNAEIQEVATGQTLWKGHVALRSGGDGISAEAQEESKKEKRRKFGDSLIKALQDAGVITAPKNG